jgi:hypothetical protein
MNVRAAGPGTFYPGGSWSPSSPDSCASHRTASTEITRGNFAHTRRRWNSHDSRSARARALSPIGAPSPGSCSPSTTAVTGTDPRG